MEPQRDQPDTRSATSASDTARRSLSVRGWVWPRRPGWLAERLSPYGLALAALVAIVLGIWVDLRNQTGALRQELVRKLAEADAYNRDSHQVATQAREAARDLEYRLGILESRVAETQNQRVAIESLYSELTRHRDDRILAEVEQILLIGSQQLQLAGNVKAGLIALEAADSRLQRTDSAQFTSVRRAIRRDADRLKSIPYVDVIGMSLRLEALGQGLDDLPLAAYQRPTQEAPNAARTEESAPMRLAREVWRDIRSLITIQRSEREEIPLVSPSQTFFLRENLRLRLMSARVALLAHDGDSFRADTRAALDWLQRYFDPNDRKVAQASTLLQQLAASDVSVEVPDISASLEAVRNVKLVRERGLR